MQTYLEVGPSLGDVSHAQSIVAVLAELEMKWLIPVAQCFLIVLCLDHENGLRQSHWSPFWL